MKIYFNSKFNKWKAAYFVFVVASILLFYYVTIPFLNANLDDYSVGSLDVDMTKLFPVVPDSLMYMVTVLHADSLMDALSFYVLYNWNMIPPLVLFSILQDNLNYVFAFNLISLYLAIVALFDNFKVDEYKYAVLLLLNTLMLFSINTINKEMLSVISILFYASYLSSDKKRYLIISLVFSLFARLNLVAFLILFIFIKRIKNKTNRILLIVAAIMVMSIAYPHIKYGVSVIEQHQEGSTSRTISIINLLSDNYMYFISIIPKLIMNLFGEMKRIFDFEPILVFTTHVMLSSIAFLIIIALNIRKKTLKITDDIFYFIILYILFFTYLAFIQHRYIFPIYPLLVLLYCRKRPKPIQNSVNSYEVLNSTILA